MARASREHLVLVVDDDPDVRSTIAEILEDRGYAVLTAADGREALERLRAAPHSPSLILLDLIMPVMDGRAFREEQRRDPKLAQIPVVFLSADGELQETLPSGVEYVSKPMGLDMLLGVVARHCA